MATFTWTPSVGASVALRPNVRRVAFGDGYEQRLPFGMTATDRVCIGVCQTASERRLFAGRMGGDIQAASAGFAPVGILSTLRLY